MGIDLDRFEGEVLQELICPICKGVLEHPLQVTTCDHIFCRNCIFKWVPKPLRCPIDQTPINMSLFLRAPRVLHNLLYRLSAKCEHASHGCNAVLKLESLDAHIAECQYKPKKVIKRLVQCEKKCGVMIPMDADDNSHNCVRELRSLIGSNLKNIYHVNQGLELQTVAIDNHKRSFKGIKIVVPTMAVLFFLEIVILVIYMCHMAFIDKK